MRTTLYLKMYLQEIYIKFVTMLVRPYLRQAIWDNLEAEARLKKSQELKKEINRPVSADDVAQRWQHGFLDIKMPCKLGRVLGGRKPCIELNITPAIMQRLTDTKFEKGMRGNTIDIIFRIPKDLVGMDESKKEEAA